MKTLPALHLGSVMFVKFSEKIVFFFFFFLSEYVIIESIGDVTYDM